ncbi:Hypothetical predicted protein [Olea europaea subsp. europaea]|uniref:Uncharacterized protein n=1 Tax=Olea europaea subsp. europaea TaxID=158383 RepID=A0A8S0U4P7_OLEEU|nr:Hypothetical predicted protein [Olea europaea subsp. europaea]
MAPNQNPRFQNTPIVSGSVGDENAGGGGTADGSAHGGDDNAGVETAKATLRVAAMINWNLSLDFLGFEVGSFSSWILLDEALGRVASMIYWNLSLDFLGFEVGSFSS